MKSRVAVCCLVVFGLLPPVLRAQEAASQPSEASKPRTVAVIEISGALTEAPLGEDLPFATAGVTSLRELVDRFRKAAADTNVAAVVVQLNAADLGTAQTEEVRRAMQAVKDAGKPIYAHADGLQMGEYVLLSGVSRLSLAPTADVWITGVRSESPYLRGLFDKLGIVPDFQTCGAYKSAAEMYMRSGPSDEAKENMEWLVDGIFETFVDLIAAGRGVGADKVKVWINHGLYTAGPAKEAGLIDAVEYREDFVAELKKQYGDNVKFDKRYGRKRGLDIDLSSPLGLFKFYADLLAGTRPKSTGKNSVAIVHVEGPILPGAPGNDPFSLLGGGAAYSTPIRAALDRAAQDETVKAVVLRVNSPGGSAVASEIILEATKRVKAKKPLVVSMGDVAGSGGYYVACGAETIFADRSTITGSIGVVSGKLSTKGLWQKLGVHWESTKRGANAGMLSGSDVFTNEQRERMQAFMDEIYGVFKGHVVAIRGAKLKKDIEELAGGRVYAGRQALELGLVDQLGGWDDAIRFVASQAGLKEGEYEIRTLPQPPSFLEMLTGEPAADPDPHSVAMPADWLRPTERLWRSAESYLEGLDPQRTAAVRQAFLLLSVMQREQVGLTMTPLRVRN